MSDTYFAEMQPDAFGQLRLAGGDRNLHVWFTRKSRKNAYQSDLQGRPVYEPIDYVKIQQPGERDYFEGPVTQAHISRFPDRYRQFLDQVDQIPEGTPIKLLFPNEDAVVETMLDLKIQTVEQLATITEQGIERLGMMGRKYVAKAQQAMDKAEARQEVTRLERVVADQTDEIAVLKQGIEQQQAQLSELRRMVQQGQQAARASQLFSNTADQLQTALAPPAMQQQVDHYEPPPQRQGGLVG